VDKRGRPTVSDFVKDVPARLYPVGRLDMDTEGVLLMTNDGLFCHRMTHPRFEIEKTYRAEVRGRPSQRVLSTLERGVNIDNGVTFPAKVKQISSTHNRTTLEITVHEGRKRQIKKMCAAVGHRVVKLKRVEFCGIRLGNLQPGQYRFLSKEEVAMLARKVGLD
jgi:pseudouridine synthase